jgi:Zn-dependent peptidase ImmA (M78 family)
VRVRRKLILTETQDLVRRFASRDPPIPVDKIARSLGASVEFQRFDGDDQDVSGFVYSRGSTKLIGVNALHPESRQRFTIAHEIGHLVLGHLTNRESIHIDKGIMRLRGESAAAGADLEEVEANVFAANLLMPIDYLRRDVARLEKEGADLGDESVVGQLARRYAVSAQALIIRFTNLGWLDQ